MQERIARLRDAIGSVYLGSAGAVDRVITCLLAGGHALIEDVPGVGKTVLASAIARSIDAKFSRLQLTPDMLPSDVLGVSIYERETGAFRFRKGPIFTNILLADEINRTTPRTQTALLEAMNEATVTIDGEHHRLEQPFLVLATQNPHDFEGTYPLPENQLDRFLMRIRLGYPSAEAEAKLLELRPASNVLPELSPVLTTAELLEMREAVEAVHMDEKVRAYVVAIARATREDAEVRVGISPRGALALAQASRAHAFVRERNYVIPEDVIDSLDPVCAHRMALRSGHGDPAAASAVLDRAIERTASPS